MCVVVSDFLCLSLIAPLFNLIFIVLLNLFTSPLANYIMSLGYPLFCGLVIYINLMYFISIIHIEETVSTTVGAFVVMLIPYFVFLKWGTNCSLCLNNHRESFNQSFNHSIFHSLIESFIHSFIHSFNKLFNIFHSILAVFFKTTMHSHSMKLPLRRFIN